jgi:histone H3/H4
MENTTLCAINANRQTIQPKDKDEYTTEGVRTENLNLTGNGR